MTNVLGFHLKIQKIYARKSQNDAIINQIILKTQLSNIFLVLEALKLLNISSFLSKILRFQKEIENEIIVPS